MSTIVNNDYPKSKKLSDDEIKAKFVSEAQKTQGADTATKSNVPTEVIDLPSKGYFYPEGHPLSTGKIEMKYMTAKEEDILATPGLIRQGIVIDKLLQSLIVTKFNYNELLTMDKNAIFIAARILGYGKDYDAEVTCPSCQVKSPVNINLQDFEEREIDWDQFTKGQCTNTYILPVSKKELEYKFLTHGDDKKIEEDVKGAKKFSKLTGIDTDLTTRLKHVIVSVDGDPSKAEISKTVDMMLAIDSLAFRKHLKLVSPDISTTFMFTCPDCTKEVTDMAVPIGINFFWPGA